MKRKFEIELNVPDDFDDTYQPPYQFGDRCVIRDGMLAWSVYADPKTPKPQWRVARASDEGGQARFSDSGVAGWTMGKLLHVDKTVEDCLFLALVDNSPQWFELCEVQV